MPSAQMARHPVRRPHFAQRRHLDPAARLDIRTAGVERAARRRVHRARHVAAQDALGAPELRVRHLCSSAVLAWLRHPLPSTTRSGTDTRVTSPVLRAPAHDQRKNDFRRATIDTKDRATPILGIVANAGLKFIRYLRWKYEAKSLEDVITRLYGAEAASLVRETKLNDIGLAWLQKEEKEAALNFASSDPAAVTVGAVVDKARAQLVKKSISDAIQNVIAAIINSKTPHYLMKARGTKDQETAFVNFEKDFMSQVMRQNRGFSAEDFTIGVPMLIVASIALFVCLGPLRTLLERWI